MNIHIGCKHTHTAKQISIYCQVVINILLRFLYTSELYEQCWQIHLEFFSMVMVWVSKSHRTLKCHVSHTNYTGDLKNVS